MILRGFFFFFRIRSSHFWGKKKTWSHAQNWILGSILGFSVKFQTSLPKKKIKRIITVISNLLTSHQGTKWDLVSLLGHLNLATHIIPLGCSFISRLLLLTSSVPALADPVIINDSFICGLYFSTTGTESLSFTTTAFLALVTCTC